LHLVGILVPHIKKKKVELKTERQIWKRTKMVTRRKHKDKESKY